MGAVKGSSAANVGYACLQQALVAGWRSVWSAEPGTTDPMAPFGIVTLASSGTEGGPNMGAMRQACVVRPPLGGTLSLTPPLALHPVSPRVRASRASRPCWVPALQRRRALSRALSNNSRPTNRG